MDQHYFLYLSLLKKLFGKPDKAPLLGDLVLV